MHTLLVFIDDPDEIGMEVFLTEKYNEVIAPLIEEYQEGQDPKQPIAERIWSAVTENSLLSKSVQTWVMDDIELHKFQIANVIHLPMTGLL